MTFQSRRFPLLRLLLGGLLLLAPVSLCAQEETPGQAQPASFLIEKISVEGPREAAANIVRAETRLREGRSYTEDELRQAVYRVHRLPFVLDATFSLRKGSERGAYELFIQVEPARWFFFDHSVQAFRFGEPVDLDEGRELGGADTVYSFPGLIGARLFVGRSGVLFGALDSDIGPQVGYAQYDLFGRGVLASLSVSGFGTFVQEAIPYGLDPGFVTWSWESSAQAAFHLAAPLRGNHSLQFDWSRRGGEAGRRWEILDPSADLQLVGAPSSGDRADLTYDRAGVKWVYDTSDDPLLPTRGLTMSAGLERSALETGPLTLVRYEPEFSEEAWPAFEAEMLAAAVDATRHWSVTPRQTVSAIGRLSAGRSRLRARPSEDPVETDLDVFGGSLGLRHGWSLRRSRRGANGLADLRLETGLELGVETNSEDIGPPQAKDALERLQLSTGLVYRNQWGRLRLALTYLDLGEVLP